MRRSLEREEEMGDRDSCSDSDSEKVESEKMEREICLDIEDEFAIFAIFA